MFAAQQNNLNNTKNKGDTKKYLDLRKLEIFLAVCCDDYIGAASVDKYISLKDVRVHISNLNQH